VTNDPLPVPDLTAGYTAADRPAVFYSPHADDECISMSLDIGNRLHEGRSVLLVLMTQGGSAWMVDVLNGAVRDNVFGLVHDPVREGYRDGVLTTATAGDSRWREFQSSALALARTSGRVRVATPDLAEGLTTAQARAVIDDVAGRLPGASHQTMTWTDPASDHAVCGRALRDARDSGAVTDARWSVSRTYHQQAVDAGTTPLEVTAASEDVTANARLSVRAYQAWAPTQGLYAYGQHSVPDELAATAADPKGYVHL
jgi:LmbE family N-acetylglucosaminyl deacetylase